LASLRVSGLVLPVFGLRGVVRDDTVSVPVSGRPSPCPFGEVPGRAVCGCKGAPVLTVGNDAAGVERMLEKAAWPARFAAGGWPGGVMAWNGGCSGRDGRAVRCGRGGPGARRAG
jgi:hypothetical protein